MERALSAIERVHGDGDLPLLPIGWSALEPGVEAIYEVVRFGENAEVPRRIVVSTVARRPGLAVIYEIGHFLDHQTLGDRGRFASRDAARLSEWRTAVAHSQAFSNLVRLRDFGIDGRVRVHARYLLAPDELWERSYAQYIAVRSSDTELIGEATALRKNVDPVYIPYLWEDADFEPIATAIDHHFQERGWIR